jgi:uncharacterized tellurite resistance protein B-like protein
MADSQIASVIRLWAAVAWVDGVLAVPEAEALRRLIRTADLTAEERDEAGRLLDGPVALPDAYLADLSDETRRGIYRAACKMAVVDHVVTSVERTLLVRLRGVLAISDLVAREVEADIPGLV